VKVPTSAILFALLSGVSAATWTICFALQEPLTWVRVLAIALIAAGILLFQAEGA